MPKHLDKCAWRPNFSHFGWKMTKILCGVGLTCTPLYLLSWINGYSMVKAYHFERLKCFWPSDEYHLNILSFIIRFFEKCKSMPYFHVDWKVKIDQILRLIQQHITSCFLWLLATLKEDGHFAFSNFNARFKIETLGFMFLMATFSELQSKNCTCLLKLQLPSPTDRR